VNHAGWSVSDWSWDRPANSPPNQTNSFEQKRVITSQLLVRLEQKVDGGEILKIIH